MNRHVVAHMAAAVTWVTGLMLAVVGTLLHREWWMLWGLLVLFVAAVITIFLIAAWAVTRVTEHVDDSADKNALRVEQIIALCVQRRDGHHGGNVSNLHH